MIRSRRGHQSSLACEVRLCSIAEEGGPEFPTLVTEGVLKSSDRCDGLNRKEYRAKFVNDSSSYQ